MIYINADWWMDRVALDEEGLLRLSGSRAEMDRMRAGISLFLSISLYLHSMCDVWGCSMGTRSIDRVRIATCRCAHCRRPSQGTPCYLFIFDLVGFDDWNFQAFFRELPEPLLPVRANLSFEYFNLLIFFFKKKNEGGFESTSSRHSCGRRSRNRHCTRFA